MGEKQYSELVAKAKKVKLLVIGVDGVLTDAGMYFSESGDLLRKFNRRDGMGLQILANYDIKSAILSSMFAPIVKTWAEMFDVDYIKLGVQDKFHEIEKLMIRHGLKLDQIAYISDDIDEAKILQQVGFGVTVADGMVINKKLSAYVTKQKGGEGAVREVIELLASCKES
jgi:YrbI family 3-deoxy-D-manno-octulosonate 8-phosphate phosphatase